MATKKIKVKITKKRINFKRIFFVLVFVTVLALAISYIISMPIKNVYIIGNNYVKDKEIIYTVGLDNYPTFINTYFLDIESKLLQNDLIKSVKVKRKIPNKLFIEIEEYRPVALYKDEIILSSKKMISNNLDINYLPYVSNNIDKVYDKFVESFSKISDDVLFKISHIEYAPNDVDKERFILYMVDANYVHITLSKIEKINKYNSIVNELNGKKGIIYLDSGDYLEIKN